MSMLGRAALAPLAAGLLTLAATSCERPAPRAPVIADDALTVFAAASLREVFTTLAADFEREHPGVRVTLHTAGSQELRTQLQHGARADVLATADERTMEELVAAGLVAAPVPFARNHLVVVVSRAASASITTLAELPGAERIVLAAPEVPAGRYADELLRRAAGPLGADFHKRVLARVVSRELNVKQVLAKLRMGEADAAVVYASDIVGLQEVTALPLPPGIEVVATYPMATVAGAEHPSLARAWQELVLSTRGQGVLQGAGFLPVAGPPP